MRYARRYTRGKETFIANEYLDIQEANHQSLASRGLPWRGPATFPQPINMRDRITSSQKLAVSDSEANRPGLPEFSAGEKPDAAATLHRRLSTGETYMLQCLMSKLERSCFRI